MRAKDLIGKTLDFTAMMLHKYVDDLSDADIKRIPVEGMNPISLQLGHLISSERMFVEGIKPGSCPALPEGFDQKHSIKEGKPDDNSRYVTKDEYLRLFDAQRQATKKVLDGLTDEQLDTPGPEKWRTFAPTWADLLSMGSNHLLMHIGQFVPVRRQAKKPIAI